MFNVICKSSTCQGLWMKISLKSLSGHVGLILIYVYCPFSNKPESLIRACPHLDEHFQFILLTAVNTSLNFQTILCFFLHWYEHSVSRCLNPTIIPSARTIIAEVPLISCIVWLSVVSVGAWLTRVRCGFGRQLSPRGVSAGTRRLRSERFDPPSRILLLLLLLLEMSQDIFLSVMCNRSCNTPNAW